MNKFFFLVSFLLAVSTTASANFSMRRCMLLPMTDSVDGAIAYKVFQEVERTLKNSSWCYYKSNSEIMNIMSQYRRNLGSHLENPEVIRVIANKLKVGSLIRVDLQSEPKGVNVHLSVISDNGSDLYFKEKTYLDRDDIGLISNTIINWLNVYEKSIPYDGQVLSVLGNQITIDIGKASRIRMGQTFKVRRPTRKKRHPLLKEIVEWETETLGAGKIFSVSEYQALGVIKLMTSEKKIVKGDWIRVDLTSADPLEKKVNFPDVKGNQFGKLGAVSLDFILANGAATSVDGSSTREIGGMGYGFNIEAIGYITRNYFGGAELEKSFASYSKKQGTLTKSENTYSGSAFKIFGGFKYLPMGFFYGPRIDLYGGYASYSNGLDTSIADGFTEATTSGILLGVKADAPIMRSVRIYGKLEILPKPGYTETTIVNGEANSVSSYLMEVGGQYTYNPIITLDGAFGIVSHKAKFTGKEVHHNRTGFKVGGTFFF